MGVEGGRSDQRHPVFRLKCDDPVRRTRCGALQDLSFPGVQAPGVCCRCVAWSRRESLGKAENAWFSFATKSDPLRHAQSEIIMSFQSHNEKAPVISRSPILSSAMSAGSKRSVGLGLPLGKSPLNLPRGPASESTRPPLRQGCATSAVRQARPPSRCGPASGKHPNIRTSHPLALECSDVRLVGQEPCKRVLELRCPVTVPREIGSLSRMNDDGTNIIVSKQRPSRRHGKAESNATSSYPVTTKGGTRPRPLRGSSRRARCCLPL